jgi:hypothetical protein
LDARIDQTQEEKASHQFEPELFFFLFGAILRAPDGGHVDG